LVTKATRQTLSFAECSYFYSSRDIHGLFASRVDRHQLASFQNECLFPEAAVKLDPMTNLEPVPLV
jgi:hypothetical protein